MALPISLLLTASSLNYQQLRRVGDSPRFLFLTVCVLPGISIHHLPQNMQDLDPPSLPKVGGLETLGHFHHSHKVTCTFHSTL